MRPKHKNIQLKQGFSIISANIQRYNFIFLSLSLPTIHKNLTQEKKIKIKEKPNNNLRIRGGRT